MLTGLSMLAATAAACPVERAEYRLRDQPATSLRFIARDTGPDWPSGLLARIDVAGSGHRYWWLLWSGGSDGRQHLASTRDPATPGWIPPRPDDGGARPLGDVDYIAADADYRLLERMPKQGDAAPAHILLSDLDEALWYRRDPADAASGDRAVRQFFDFSGCAAR